MAGLLEKDIRLILQRKQALILFVALSVLLGYTQEGTFILGYLPVLILLLAVSTISYDELDHGFTFLMTLPIDAKTYVIEKYVFCGSAGILSWFMAIVIYAVAGMMHGKSMAIADEILMLLMFLVVVVFMMAFMIPIQIKFGANGSRMIILVVFGITMLLTFALKAVIGEERISAIQQALDTISDISVSIISIALVVLSLVISYLCSLKAMRKKVL